MGPSLFDLACLECATVGRFLSPDDTGAGDVGPGAVLMCGMCGELYVLEAQRRDGQWGPMLRRPGRPLEFLEIRQRPAVAALLSAYATAQLERQMSQAARKGPKPGKGLLVKDGGNLRLGGYGPDYRGER